MFWVVLGGICEEGDLVERFLVVFHDLDDLGKGGSTLPGHQGKAGTFAHTASLNWY